MERNHMYGLVAVVVGGFLVYLLFRGTGKRSDDMYRNGIIDDATEWFANHQGVAIPEAKSALRDLINGEKSHPILDGLVRIDCELTKESADRITRTVAVAVQRDGKVIVGKVTRDLAWDELPSAVREAFMRENAKTQSYVVVERQSESQHS
ncbi:MAG: hypothetical protein WCT04_09640 [Planctomycetota bacterium]